MSKVLLLANHALTIINFRTELVERLLAEGHTVVISAPYSERIEELTAMGCEYRDIAISRHGMNPVQELKLLSAYKRLLKEIRPDMVFSYTIKPNIYGAIACRKAGIPLVANVTGLGTAVENRGLVQGITVTLYRFAFRRVRKVFFQNTENLRFFTERGILKDGYALLPGSGVNTRRFSVLDYPESSPVRFLFIGRLMKDKGIEEYLAAARSIKERYPDTEFHICGFCEPEYEGRLEEITRDNTVIYHGLVKDTRPFLQTAHCTVLPSYHEGMANVLLESAACGRPVIATDVPGCRETYDDGVTGLSCKPASPEDLIRAMERFLALSPDERKSMGLAGREKVVSQFDREIVIQAYLAELESL